MAARIQMTQSVAAIPSDILSWLNQNAHCRPTDLVDSLIKAGHPANKSEIWVKVYFLSKSHSMMTSNQKGLNYFAPDGNFGHAFPNYLTLVSHKNGGDAGKDVKIVNTSYPISFACTAPRVLHVLDVLSTEECDAIVQASRPSLTPSTVVSNTDTNSALARDVRSSYGTYFPRDSHPAVKVVESRIAELFRFPLSHAEPIQILNYAQNAEYKPHHDYFDENTAEGQRIVSQSGNRVATIIIYLNEVERGGATIFPKLNLQVLPRKGSALYFDYFLSEGIYDPDSLHGGTPVLAGEKWIATQWVRRLPYSG